MWSTAASKRPLWNSITIARRSYISRAHPRPIPQYPVAVALQQVLDGIQDRRQTRAAKWERNAGARQAKGKQDSGPYRNLDETVELAINLNVDPRRPGQALRGSLQLPHGTGKTIACLVFTNDESVIEQANNQGHLAGGDVLVQQVLNGEVSLDAYSRALATKDVLPSIQKQLARLLGPRGLMPNPKTNTVLETSQELLETLQQQSQTVTYRTESNGILQLAIGKGSFTPQQLLDNLQAVCQTVQNIKPEQYGKGKKKAKTKKKMGKNVKYWLKAHVSSTQGKGVAMDLRTIDPTSPFFMKDPE